MVRGRSAWFVGLLAAGVGAASACASLDGLTDAGTGNTTAGDATTASDAFAGADGGDATVANDGSGDAAANLPDVQIIDAAGGTCACLTTPPGWIGPLALWDGPGSPPACGPDYPTPTLDASADPSAPPATCGCTCDPPMGNLDCPTSFPVAIFETASCTGTPCDSVMVSAGACVNVQANCTFANGMAARPSAPNASCAARPTKAVAPFTWGTNARACEIATPPTQGACGAGELCVPLPRAPMGARPCVMFPGDVPCPGGGYAVRHVFHGSATDDRGCSACTCGPASCAGTITQCSGPPGPIAIPTTCAPLGDPAGLQLTAPLVLDAGPCPPSAVQPTGGVTPTKPTTVCCAP